MVRKDGAMKFYLIPYVKPVFYELQSDFPHPHNFQSDRTRKKGTYDLQVMKIYISYVTTWPFAENRHSVICRKIVILS